MRHQQPVDEGRLVEELYALIRQLHRPRKAEAIIQTFESAFAACETAAERVGLCEHWLEIYLLEKLRKFRQRRRPTYEERTTPCSACGYPTSQRHHLWDVATHGENKVTLQLCPNCHELQHLIYNALTKKSDYSRKLAQHILFSSRVSSEIVEKILGWCRATIQYEVEMGWLESYKTSDAWLEKRLRWSDYQRRDDENSTKRPA
jgi:ribosomal protein L37E